MKTLFALVLAAFALALSPSAGAQCSQSNPCVTITNSGSGDALDLSVAAGGAALNASGIIEGTVSSGFAASFITWDSSAAAAVRGEAASYANGVEGICHNVYASGVYGVNDHGGWGVFSRGNAGGTTSWSNQSDARLKKDIAPLADPLDALLKLHGVSFTWKDPMEHGNAQGTQVGFIAQEVEKVYPGWVSEGPDGYKLVRTEGALPMLVESVRVLKADNDALRGRVRRLEGRSLIGSLSSVGLGLAMFGVAVVVARGGLRRKRSR